MAENEMKAKAGLPERVRSNEGLGVAFTVDRLARLREGGPKPLFFCR